MTVKELKDILKDKDDNMQILICFDKNNDTVKPVTDMDIKMYIPEFDYSGYAWNLEEYELEKKFASYPFNIEYKPDSIVLFSKITKDELI
jgi:predicted esterase YcpF (UPF0227 family)